MKQSKTNQLPKTPGVYLLKSVKGQVLYIGKALNIRSRVKSHFSQKAINSDLKKPILQKEVTSVDFIEVQSEIEALLLEANLIKKYQPRFNARLKDDKSYLYIKITKSDDYPKVLTARREKLPGSVYFGPFPSAKTVKFTLKSLRHIFPYCNCNFKVCQKRQSCLWTEIGLDAGPCLDRITKTEYRKIIKGLTLLLLGKKERVVKNLKREMDRAAKREEYEKAQKYKKQIEGIEYLTRPITSSSLYLENSDYLFQKRQEGLLELQKELVLPRPPGRIECFDISHIQGRQASGSMVVFQKGEPDKSQYRRFKVQIEGKPNDVAMMKEIITRRLNHQEWPPADLVVVDGGKGQVSGALSVLNKAAIQIPLIGLAKRIEEIIIPKGGNANGLQFGILRLPAGSSALQLLRAIRDEAHRFAVTYHRKLRIKILTS